MEITINMDEATPVYEQIISQVSEGAITGKISIGSMLPTIRQLAADLEVNPNTVAKAYQFLERHGVIITGGRKGTFISENAIENVNKHLETKVTLRFKNLIEEAKAAGLSEYKLKKIFTETVKEVKFRGL